jgi:hypothetical protein
LFVPDPLAGGSAYQGTRKPDSVSAVTQDGNANALSAGTPAELGRTTASAWEPPGQHDCVLDIQDEQMVVYAKRGHAGSLIDQGRGKRWPGGHGAPRRSLDGFRRLDGFGSQKPAGFTVMPLLRISASDMQRRWYDAPGVTVTRWASNASTESKPNAHVGH